MDKCENIASVAGNTFRNRRSPMRDQTVQQQNNFGRKALNVNGGDIIRITLRDQKQWLTQIENSFCDLLLYCAKNREPLQAHRAVLSVYSKFFRELLKNENIWICSTVFIIDYMYEDISNLIRLLYFGSVNLTRREAINLRIIIEDFQFGMNLAYSSISGTLMSLGFVQSESTTNTNGDKTLNGPESIQSENELKHRKGSNRAWDHYSTTSKGFEVIPLSYSPPSEYSPVSVHALSENSEMQNVSPKTYPRSKSSASTAVADPKLADPLWFSEQAVVNCGEIPKTNFNNTEDFQLDNLENNDNACYNSSIPLPHSKTKRRSTCSGNSGEVPLLDYFDQTDISEHLPLKLARKSEVRQGKNESIVLCSKCGAITSDNKKNLHICPGKRVLSTTRQEKLASELELLMNFDCIYCKKRFFSEGALHKHMKLHHIPGGMVCVKCKILFDNKQKFVAHNSFHRKGKLVECSLCGKEELSTIIDIHLKKHAAERLNHCGDRRVCPVCSRTFKEEAHVVNHLLFHFDEEREHECKICYFVTETDDALKVHHKIEHELSKALPVNKKIEKTQLPQINRVTRKAWKSKDKEVEIDVSQMGWMCSTCGMLFTNSSDCQNHIVSFHTE
ncbi:zinc finger protein 211-like [Artemia franciscana]|uniref:Uncharacterized protein n=1 Tax=Artemia franciscana TaxID=6661 RepID=A0AA88HCK3_ARTSF|nr:hypothetical protein QYM36_018366 [Artemia franciscana]KAK2703081.1 hypothetical protein QYM36_018366 [Artemia franciscana]